MQDLVSGQTNWLTIKDNVELSTWSFDDAMAFIGADEAIAA